MTETNVLQDQHILISKLQAISQKRPILVQHELKDRWHPLPCQHDRLILTRSILPREIVFDFDGKEWPEIAQEAARLKTYLDAKDVPYWLAWTGGKGIHIHIFIKPLTEPFDNDVQEAIKSEELDVLRVARETLSEHLVDDSKLDRDKARLDPLKMSWSQSTKGSMIRGFGAVREDGGCKTLLDAVPYDRPKPGELPLRFPSEVKLWDVSEFHQLINARLKKQIEAMKRDQIELSGYDGIALDVPCYRFLMEGLDEGTRNQGAHDLARLAKLLNVPEEKARKDLIAYAHKCEGANGELEKEALSTFENVWKREEKVKRPSCYGFKQRYGEAVCDRTGCPLGKVKKVEVISIQLTDPELVSKLKQALYDGTWKILIQKGMDQVIAGEDNAKWSHFYSGLTASLPDKFPIDLTGKSQRGKSWVQNQMGTTFFSDIYLDIDISARVLQYKAREKNNPHLLDGKILQQDELADSPDQVRDFVKKLTTNRRKKLSYESLDKNNKPIDLELEGMPVVWANHMDTLDEKGNQLMNRFFKMNVDESIAQSRTVEQHQKNEMMYGRKMNEEAISVAKKLIEIITSEGGFEVLNPFASFLEQGDYSVLNRLPLYHTLLTGIAYANRFARPSIETDGQKYIMASLTDNLEALKIFYDNEKYQRTSLAERHQRLLALMSPGYWMTKYELQEAWRQKYTDEKAISAETVYQYAHELEEKDVITSQPVENGRGIEYSLIEFENSSKRLLDIKNPDKKILAENIKRATLVSSQLTEIGIEGLATTLWNTEITHIIVPQTHIDEGFEKGDKE